MNKDRLKEFVNALDALSDDIKDMKVDMGSTSKPSCDTCGCHAGLISIVAKDLPELQEAYKHLCSLHLEEEGYNNPYIYTFWARALAVFLGFKDRFSFIYWAGDNPEIWGNEHGVAMFVLAKAFTDDESKKLTHRDIINHWKQVLVNIEREKDMKKKLKEILDDFSDEIELMVVLVFYFIVGGLLLSYLLWVLLDYPVLF